MVIWSWRPFLFSSSVYSCHLLISSAFFFFFLVLYYAHLCVKCSFGISSSLEEISGPNHSNVLFYFFFFHCTLKKALLSLLAILWNCAFRWVYLSFSPLPFTSLLFSAICKASSDNHFALLQFFFLKIVLVTISCTMLWTSAFSFLGILSIRSNPLNLFVTSTVSS